ncbi:MAG TPA: MFS transporter [Candidatus Limnocylindrales bacterium]|nr:MFS transporter [Candidatus Limnocylindrales bacterium]
MDADAPRIDATAGRSSSSAPLLAFALGVFIVGVELMITAVALPPILADLADWTQLREASWIVNGYLVAYVAIIPLAGRAADRYSVPLLFAGSLIVFAIGSLLAGAAQSLEWLIAARVMQGIGAGAVVPLATAGASHLYGGRLRARAIGVVGAATFLGMAAGPFLGAAILQSIQVPGETLFGPSWRWVFYLAAPLAALAALYMWAASPDWRASQHAGANEPLDIIGAALFTAAVAAGLVALTLVGEADSVMILGLAALAIVALGLSLWRFSRARAPFIDLRHFADRTFSGAVLLSLLTGYALATAIIGGAVFVDRVRYSGPDEQQLALGALAGSMAVGALLAGFVVRRLGVRLPSLLGLGLSIAGLLLLATLTPGSAIALLSGGLALFGFGFGLTVTARSTAAVEALGAAAFGVAAAGVTVARMLGMGIGLAALTVLGSNRIESLSVVLVDQAARDAVLPAALQGRPLEDYLVVDALERWAADQAAGILSVVFLVAAVVTALAIVPTLAMRDRPGAARGSDQEGSVDGVAEASRAGLAI